MFQIYDGFLWICPGQNFSFYFAYFIKIIAASFHLFCRQNFKFEIRAFLLLILAQFFWIYIYFYLLIDMCKKSNFYQLWLTLIFIIGYWYFLKYIYSLFDLFIRICCWFRIRMILWCHLFDRCGVICTG